MAAVASTACLPCGFTGGEGRGRGQGRAHRAMVLGPRPRAPALRPPEVAGAVEGERLRARYARREALAVGVHHHLMWAEGEGGGEGEGGSEIEGEGAARGPATSSSLPHSKG